MRTLGIDEAGRGCILGPMVLAAVIVSDDQGRTLSARGVRDSKRYSKNADPHALRLKLAKFIRENSAHVEVAEVSVETIDERVRKCELNFLEREVAVGLIEGAPGADKIILDGESIFRSLRRSFKNLLAENKADAKYPAVAAASVVAKAHRDDIVHGILAKYQEEFGEIRGNGYPNRPTYAFLRAFNARYGRLPPETRLSWNLGFLRHPSNG